MPAEPNVEQNRRHIAPGEILAIARMYLLGQTGFDIRVLLTVVERLVLPELLLVHRHEDIWASIRNSVVDFPEISIPDRFPYDLRANSFSL